MSQISVSDRTPPVAASEMTVHSDTVSPLKKKENSASIFRTCQSLNIKNRWKFWSSNTIFSVMERVAIVGCEWKQNAWIWFMLLLTKPCGRVKSVFAYRFLYSLNLVHRRSSDKRLFVLIFSSLYNHSARKLSRN